MPLMTKEVDGEVKTRNVLPIDVKDNLADGWTIVSPPKPASAAPSQGAAAVTGAEGGSIGGGAPAPGDATETPASDEGGDGTADDEVATGDAPSASDDTPPAAPPASEAAAATSGALKVARAGKK